MKELFNSIFVHRHRDKESIIRFVVAVFTPLSRAFPSCTHHIPFEILVIIPPILRSNVIRMQGAMPQGSRRNNLPLQASVSQELVPEVPGLGAL